MPVGRRETGERLARHLKTFQNAVIHQRDAFGRRAFVVEWVIANQNVLAQFSLRRIVVDRKKIRKNRLAYLAGKRLAFVDVLLAESFGAMAENFVEENGGGAAGQHGRAGI